MRIFKSTETVDSPPARLINKSLLEAIVLIWEIISIAQDRSFLLILTCAIIITF